ncbi:MAG: 3-methyl-2-oxobutanoate hydroxymethyltransferase, partial [Elusimicrobiota bacterium]|nr:3-methyl-2-oxobutanoate hydroxymethyltransferase [Elusimicrobiota bacterium]
NAGTFIKEGGANAVKLEGGLEIEKQVRAIVNAKIPVMGHLGFTPQSLNKLGGFKIQAKDKDSQDKLIEDAKILEKSGVFSIVLEAIPESIAKEVTKQLSVPTIGIGAGRYCSGQVLVVDDMLGMNDCFVPKFVKKYASLSEVIKNAVKNYIHDVKTGKFPDDETIYK